MTDWTIERDDAGDPTRMVGGVHLHPVTFRIPGVGTVRTPAEDAARDLVYQWQHGASMDDLARMHGIDVLTVEQLIREATRP